MSTEDKYELNRRERKINKYLILQRCRHFAKWPNDLYLSDVNRKLQINVNGVELSVHINFGIQTFDEIEIKSEDGKSIYDPSTGASDAKKGLLILDSGKRSGFPLGRHIIIPSGNVSTEISAHYRHANPGEVDFFLAIQSVKEIPIDYIDSKFVPLLSTLVGAAALQIEDIIVPTLDPQISKLLDDGKRELTSQYIAKARNRADISCHNVKDIFPTFIDALQSLTEEDMLRVSVAVRRYLTSLTETDAVDRYCDLWEACEFLSKIQKPPINKKNVSGPGPAPGIANNLSEQTGLPAKDIYNIIIRPLYLLRNDLVHNAFAFPAYLDEMSEILSVVSSELIKFHLCIRTNSKDDLSDILKHPERLHRPPPIGQ